jgi:hypothetical protein
LGIAWGAIRNRNKEYYPFYFKMPSWISIEYWYLKVIHSIVLIYFIALKIYDGIKLAAVSVLRRSIITPYRIIRNILTETTLTLKKNFVIFTYLAARRLLPLILEHSGDIALGALVIVISLIILLTVTLF